VPYVTIKELLEAGVHFGHQASKWHPKMKPYIFDEREGVHIIDLEKTVPLFDRAYMFIVDVVSKGGKVLFVGTKKQAQAAIKEDAERCGMFYVNTRWLGGTLTNFNTIKKSIEKLEELEQKEAEGYFEKLPKKEATRLRRKLMRLRKYLGGLKGMKKLPDALFVIDVKKEEIAVKEAKKMGIPVVAVVDTNSCPDLVDYIIPGNDDAIKACKLFTSKIADACIQGRKIYEESLKEVPQNESG
jgi:small subunit ribosomal protein S2